MDGAPKKSYRDLIVWQRAIETCLTVYKVTQTFPREELYGLGNQMRRSGVSVPSNIAEGYGRLSRDQYKHFLGIAQASNFELQTQLLIAKELRIPFSLPLRRVAAEPPAGRGAGVRKNGAGAAFHLGSHEVVLFFAALERGGEILLDLDGLEAVTVGRTKAKDDPVAEPEQKDRHGQNLRQELEPRERLADERVHRTPGPLPSVIKISRSPGLPLAAADRCVVHGKLIPYKS
jgi:four helix bundle protein